MIDRLGVGRDTIGYGLIALHLRTGHHLRSPVRIKCSCLRQPASKLHSFGEHAQISFAAEIVGLDHWRRKRVTGAQADAPPAFLERYSPKSSQALTHTLTHPMF